MKIEEVGKMQPVDRFLYWIKERHKVYKKKEAGKKKPWTDDEVLQTVFFTNPYRENDRVTKWFREHIREPLDYTPEVLFATVAFRWFNKPDPTGMAMIEHGLHLKWNERKAVKVINKLTESGPVFTGAYMIKAGNGPRGCKVPNVCAAITNVWKKRKELVRICLEENSMESFVKALAQFPHLGKFMSYEVACDLRYTYLLEEASDIMTWANPGPGAQRGIKRLNGLSVEWGVDKVTETECIEQMRTLLKITQRKLKSLPPFEMREIEHSLCEWDKYERARLGTGRLKRKYDARGEL